MCVTNNKADLGWHQGYCYYFLPEPWLRTLTVNISGAFGRGA